MSARPPIRVSMSQPKDDQAAISLYHSDKSHIRASSAVPYVQTAVVCRQHLPTQLPPSSPFTSPAATPGPSPLRKRSRVSPHKPLRSLQPKKSDAYDFIRPDTDGEWSTLPTGKKFKAAQRSKPKTNGIKTTAPFSLLGTLAKPKVTGISASSERRVVTFLPPPLKAKNLDVLVEDAGESPRPDVSGAPPWRATKHSRESDSSPATATPKRRRVAENPYPSPANSRLTPGDATAYVDQPYMACSSPLSSPAAAATQPWAHHHIPSPPTSDPFPEFHPDVQATVAIDGVLLRYPRTKNLRRHGLDDLWDLLDLPSCGIVRSDDDNGTLNLELPVVFWQGQGNVV
ncbi:hypothetical protein B0H15DRAFT_942803 [Mycena belliarum]|uniref:Uncharacterized protein n=1 Tax=Mycena belliarum TaxID=1033014 RepID=A0AAD6UHB1_9AGAR|nr:hypothetical protein B0H15DRAFT_942803 [Mycena belliae]